MGEYNENLVILSKIYSVAQNTAPVTLSIGYVLENQCKKGIVIHKAPPKVIRELVNSGYMCDMMPDGMHVYAI